MLWHRRRQQQHNSSSAGRRSCQWMWQQRQQRCWRLEGRKVAQKVGRRVACALSPSCCKRACGVGSEHIADPPKAHCLLNGVYGESVCWDAGCHPCKWATVAQPSQQNMWSKT